MKKLMGLFTRQTAVPAKADAHNAYRRFPLNLADEFKARPTTGAHLVSVYRAKLKRGTLTID